MACNINVLLVEMLRNAKIIMATLWNRAGHYIFVLWFLLPSFFPYWGSSPGASFVVT